MNRFYAYVFLSDIFLNAKCYIFTLSLYIITYVFLKINTFLIVSRIILCYNYHAKFIRFSARLILKILKLTPADDVQSAVNSLSEPAVVYLSDGIYNQKIEIRADDVTLIGESRESTVITYGDYARKIHADGKEYNTFRTYALCVSGNRARLENLTVINSNTNPAEAGQCVALSVNGKFFSAENVDIRSTQDTLFLSPFPDDLVVRYKGFIPERQLYSEGKSLHLFKNCRIYGTVDFIFGCSEAYFKDCEIISVYDSRKTGFIAAPAHSLAEDYGFNFIGCNLITLGAGGNEVFLARPWRDFGKCAFVNCNLGKHIKPELFDKWNDTNRDETARFFYYGLSGTGHDPAAWAKELSEEQAKRIIERCGQCFNTIKQ